MKKETERMNVLRLVYSGSVGKEFVAVQRCVRCVNAFSCFIKKQMPLIWTQWEWIYLNVFIFCYVTDQRSSLFIFQQIIGIIMFAY